MVDDYVIWKPLSLYPEIEGDYFVSEYGEILSKDRLVFVDAGDRNSSYYRHYSARSIIPRNNNKSPHLFVTIMKVIDGFKWVKTIYIHKLVAQLFLDPPKEGRVYVEHLNDDFNNNHYSNLRWITHSELAKRNHRRYPEHINRLKEHNIKSGYYNRKNKNWK